MSYGRLFLAGNSAHIVPPTGAKGLNLAVSDVFYLHRALVAKIKGSEDRYLQRYSETALRRVWNAERLSWQLTKLLHVFPDDDDFTRRVNLNEFDYLAGITRGAGRAGGAICGVTIRGIAAA